MDFFYHLFPEIAIMLILMVFSAFFSSSEAAFFSLKQSDKRALEQGGSLAKLVLRLSANTEQLLNSVLLGNLIVNLLTFTLSTILMFKLQKAGHAHYVGILALTTLLGVILFCEVLPKSLGVIAPRLFATLWAFPVMLVVRILQPVLPILKKTNILSRRLFYPNFVPESYLRVGDLERAVEMSKEDATLLRREQRVLQNIVSLSDIRAEELMRPRTMIRFFKPTVTFDEILDSLHGKLPRSGYCILTESNSDEIASVLSFTRLTPNAMDHWKDHFEPMIFVPWSASVAEVFQRLQDDHNNIAAVVNEYGETIGILTMDDIIETIFTREQGRSRRLLDCMELKKVGPKLWQVNELTSLRRLHRKFGLDSNGFSSLTVGGLLREILERFPRKGDVCQCDGFEFRVVDAGSIAEEHDEGLIIQMQKLNEHPNELTGGVNSR